MPRSLSIDFREWQLAGSDVQNTVKCHGWPVANRAWVTISGIRCTKHTQSNVMAGQWRSLFGVWHEWCVLTLTNETHSHRSGCRQYISRHITDFCTSDPVWLIRENLLISNENMNETIWNKIFYLEIVVLFCLLDWPCFTLKSFYILPVRLTMLWEN